MPSGLVTNWHDTVPTLHSSHTQCENLKPTKHAKATHTKPTLQAKLMAVPSGYERWFKLDDTDIESSPGDHKDELVAERRYLSDQPEDSAEDTNIKEHCDCVLSEFLIPLFTASLMRHVILIQYYLAVAIKANKTAGRSPTCKKFTNDDIPGPHGTKANWMKIFHPMWIEYLGTLSDPWDNTDLLETAQQLWDDVFPQNPQVL